MSRHPKHLAVLNAAAEKAGWGTPTASAIVKAPRRHNARFNDRLCSVCLSLDRIERNPTVALLQSLRRHIITTSKFVPICILRWEQP